MGEMKRNSALFVDIGQGLSIMLGLPRVATWETTERPKEAKRGVFGFNTETNQLEYFDGKYWLAASMDKA